jgi:hypothetical protein
VTISDVFEAPLALPADSKGERERGRAPARDMVTDGDLAVPSVARRAASAVRDDLHSAWLWDAHGPSLRQLWQTRIPTLEQVPGENPVLHKAWIGYNHIALLVIVPALFALWVACHPARLLYVLPIAVPLTALWLL